VAAIDRDVVFGTTGDGISRRPPDLRHIGEIDRRIDAAMALGQINAQFYVAYRPDRTLRRFNTIRYSKR
jgi:hypothetical protein